MDSFLPSEIGRLIYGYLRKQCGEYLADEFLNSCDVMEECRVMKYRYAKKFHTTVQDLTLEGILDQYSVLCSLIFRNTNEEESVHRNVLSLLKNILNSRLGLAEGGVGGGGGDDHDDGLKNYVRNVSPCVVDSSTVTSCERVTAPVIETTMPAANGCSSDLQGNGTQSVSAAIPAKLTNATNLSASLVDSKANENVYANEVHLVEKITNTNLSVNDCQPNNNTPTSTNVDVFLNSLLNSRSSYRGSNDGLRNNVTGTQGTVIKSSAPVLEGISVPAIETLIPAQSDRSAEDGAVQRTESEYVIFEQLASPSNVPSSLVDSKMKENRNGNEAHVLTKMTYPNPKVSGCELNNGTTSSSSSSKVDTLLKDISNSRVDAGGGSNDVVVNGGTTAETSVTTSRSPRIATAGGISVPVIETAAPTHISSSSTDLQKTASEVSCSTAFNLENLCGTGEAAASDLPVTTVTRSPSHEIFSNSILRNDEARKAKCGVQAESTKPSTNVEHHHAVPANLTTDSLNLSTSLVDLEANDHSCANEAQLIEKIGNPNLSASSTELNDSRVSTSSVVASATTQEAAHQEEVVFALKNSNTHDRHKLSKPFANESADFKLDVGHPPKIFGIARVNVGDRDRDRDRVEKKSDHCKQSAAKCANSPAKKPFSKCDSMNLRSKARATNNEGKSKENSPAAEKCRGANTPTKSSSCPLNETLKQAKNCNVRLNYMTPPKRTAGAAKDCELSVDKTVLMSPFSKILLSPLKPLSKLLEESNSTTTSSAENDTRPPLKSSANRFDEDEDTNVFLTSKHRHESNKEESTSSVAEHPKRGGSLPWDYKLRQAIAQEEAAAIAAAAAASQKPANREANGKKKKETPKKRKIREVNEDEHFESKRAKTGGGENHAEVTSDTVAIDCKNGANVGTTTTSRRRRNTKPKVTSESTNETTAAGGQKADEAKRKRCKKERKTGAEAPCKNTSLSTIEKIIENVVRNGNANSPAIKSSEANERTCGPTKSDASLDRRKMDEYLENKVSRKIESLFCENEEGVNDDTVLSNAKPTQAKSSAAEDVGGKPSAKDEKTVNHVVKQNVFSLNDGDGDSCDTFELKFSEVMVFYSKYID